MAVRRRSGPGPGDVADYVEIVTGGEVVGQRFRQLQRSAEQELMVFVKGPFINPTEEQVALERELLERGTHVRGLYERCALEDPDDRGQVLRLLPDGEDARVLPTLPMKLAIADSSLALVPLDTSRAGGDAAFLVHPCGLLDALPAGRGALAGGGADRAGR